MRTYDASSIGIEIDESQLKRVFNEARAGGFAFIRGYEPLIHPGEVADYHLQFGINYASVKARGIRRMDKMIADKDRSVHVEHNAWILPEDLVSVKNGYVCDVSWEVSDGQRLHGHGNARLALDFGRVSNHPNKEEGRIKVALKYTIRGKTLVPFLVKAKNRLLNSRRSLARYDSQARGYYECRSNGHLCIRECLEVHKVVRRPGSDEFHASLPRTAVLDRIEELCVGKYRQFLQGRFASITVDRQAILFDEEGLTYAALPEATRQLVLVNA